MSIVLPSGFRFAGVSCGIKKAAGKKDLTLIVGESPLVAAGVYTQNQVCAAPVHWCRCRTPGDNLRAVVINSGNANACTGEQGAANTESMAILCAKQIGCQPEDVLVMSTGIIGVQLPMDRISTGIEHAAGELEADAEHFFDAVDGIMTTDVGRKTATRTLNLPSQTIKLVGMCKGAGMIGPNMATMLGIVATDANLLPADAQGMLLDIAEVSFNAISVEGHTSTNDSLVLLASGKSSSKPLAGDDLREFHESLEALCIELAKQIPADGEGATHVMEIRIKGAPDAAAARHVARTVGDSALVKTAIHGGDPNWGRIVSAAGYAGIPLEPKKLSLSINGLAVFSAGQPTAFDAREVSNSMRAEKVVVLELCIGSGSGETVFWASDLTVEYVRFNAEYTT